MASVAQAQSVRTEQLHRYPHGFTIAALVFRSSFFGNNPSSKK
jgi:hypothetical protein